MMFELEDEAERTLYELNFKELEDKINEARAT